jgi:TatA/E family protein of Tat protein translocase
MFGMGMPEIILILVVALIVIGPKKLPDLAKSLGRALGEFKKATNDFKDSINMDSTLNDVKDEFKDLEKRVKHPLSSSDKDKKSKDKPPSKEKDEKADYAKDPGQYTKNAKAEDVTDGSDTKADEKTESKSADAAPEADTSTESESRDTASEPKTDTVTADATPTDTTAPPGGQPKDA